MPTATLSIDHNLIDGFRSYEGEVRGTPFVEGDPRFVGAAGGDFHLLGDSPAIDQGSSLDAPAVDYDGVHRPYGPGFDIGAYEVVAYAYWVYLPLLQRNH